MKSNGIVRTLTAGIVVGVVAAGTFHVVAGETRAFPSVERVLQQTLEDMPGQEVRMEVVTFPPGATSPDHRHPGHVFVYVLEGEIETRVGDGAVTRYKAGESFYEPKNALHADGRNPSETATTKILAVMLTEEGKPTLVLEH